MSRADTCFFTISSRNYLHCSRTLLESVRLHAPGADILLALCDDMPASDAAKEPFEVLQLRDLELPQRDRFIFQYTVLELNTAIKPFVFQELFRRGYRKVVYFDPDMRVYRSLDGMRQALDSCNILLTPHLTAPMTQPGRPDEREILICGTYNLGYLGLAKSDEADRLLEWWRGKMLRDCVVDFERGLFVDQKWMDFTTSFFERVRVERNPGWNVAYWNLPQRRVEGSLPAITVNGEPLLFFHFSGLDVPGGVFSKHQDRYTLDNLPPAVRALVDDYDATLRRHGHPGTAQLTYAHGAFPNGTPIPDLARRIYRESRDQIEERFDNMLGEGADRFMAYVNEPAEVNGRSTPLVTRIALEVHRTRDDLGLATQFPDVLGAHAHAFAQWYVESAKEFCRLPDAFIAPVRAALAAASPASATPPTAAGSTGLNKFLYRMAWKYKNLTHWLLPLPVRQQIHAWLFRRAYVKPTPANDQASTASTVQALPKGMNIVGYIHAELGVGEAARCTMRSCDAAGVPYAMIDFRKGVQSRMDEVVPDGRPRKQTYGVNLLHINADATPYAIAEFDTAFFKDHYNIGFWNWELPELPDDMAESFQYVNEVWAPSAFCHETFSKRAKIPVTRVPYCIDFEVDKSITRAQLGLPQEGFVFLFMFDALSVPERKNPFALIDAYKRALPSFNEPTHLVLKVINGEHASEAMDRIREMTRNTPSIEFLQRYFKRPELNSLFANADCYASLHRSEGYGLTLAESMYLGKPVIATGWSSNIDFMTPWNSMLVRHKLVELEKDYGPYRKGQVWADPDVDHAAECMVRIVNEHNLREALGREASRHIRETLSPQAVGKIIRARLTAIGAL